MSNKQQSSVQWFYDKLIEQRIIVVNQTTYQVKYKHEILLEQAKEMEKEQILKAYDAGDADRVYQPQQYYNETYGGNK